VTFFVVMSTIFHDGILCRSTCVPHFCHSVVLVLRSLKVFVE